MCGTPPQYPIGLDHRRAGPKIGSKSPPAGSNQGQKPRKLTCRDLLILIDALSHPDCRATLMMPERFAFTVSFHTWKASAETRLSKG
jgi:hypothetical protein